MKKFPYFTTFFAFLTLVLCVSVGYLISTLVVTTNLFQTTSKVESQNNTYYLLSIYQNENKEDCENNLQNFQNQGCAGYIYENDGKYHIIASIYDNVNDAELVKSSLQANGYTVEILNYKISGFSLEGNFSTPEQQVLKDCLQVQNKIYKSLYDVSVSLDTNVYDELTARFNVNETYSNFLTTKNNFETLFSEKNNNDIISIRELFNTISSELETLTNSKENFSSAIKLAYCNIILANYN